MTGRRACFSVCVCVCACVCVRVVVSTEQEVCLLGFEPEGLGGETLNAPQTVREGHGTAAVRCA